MTTPPFQVYVDGPRDRSPAAVSKLAAAIATRYGLPPADIASRLARGRFRVKANADRATAEQYYRDLERLGAVCSIVDAKGAPVDLAATAKGIPPSPMLPRPTSAPLPPPRPTSGPVTSGLAAASHGGSGADLGALGRDDGAIALASLDGEEEPLIEPTSHLAASFGPSTSAARSTSGAAKTAAGAKTPPPSAARDFAGPAGDLFAAPDAEAEVELALDVDVVAEKKKRAATAPSASATAADKRAPSRPSLDPVAPPVARAVRVPGPPLGDRARGLFADAKVRFAAGVVVAILLGFVPAAVVGKIREDAAFAEIDGKLQDRQAAVSTLEEYQALDQIRARTLERKYAERRDLAITALLIWAAVGAACAYVWFRRVPWDRITAAPG